MILGHGKGCTASDKKLRSFPSEQKYCGPGNEPTDVRSESNPGGVSRYRGTQ